MPSVIYQALLAKGPEALLEEWVEVEELQPHDPRLPEQLSIQAITPVANVMALMDMRLLDAPPGASFVLGDRPLPLRSMALGFDVPLSSSLAYQAWPAPLHSPRVLERRIASMQEMNEINRRQAKRAKEVLIGPDKQGLEALKSFMKA